MIALDLSPALVSNLWTTTPQARFWLKVDRLAPGGCWQWLGATDRHGYGNCKPDSRIKTKLAHRLAYEWTKGPIPNGMCLDHLCRNRLCVNPDHLEPVTSRENSRRGVDARTHCRKGHELTPDNIAPEGRKRCLACAIDCARRSWDKKQLRRLGLSDAQINAMEFPRW